MEKAEEASSFGYRLIRASQMPHIYLAGAIYPDIGQYEKAVEARQRGNPLESELSPLLHTPHV